MIDQPQIINDPLGNAASALDWLRDHVTPAQVHLGIAKDNAINMALAEIQPLWTPEEVARRCVFMRSVGDERETLFVDGRAVLVFEAGELTQQWKDDRIIVTFTQCFRRIQKLG